ncbi:MAG: hypothetical protein ACRDMV_16870 [Streptosporangiales bacterium]
MSMSASHQEFSGPAVEASWKRLLEEYAAARPDADLTPLWTDLVVTATRAERDQADDEAQGYAPEPREPSDPEDVVVEVMNGVSDIVVRLCADVVLQGDDSDPGALVREARRLNDRYCDLYDLVIARHPDAGLGEDEGEADIRMMIGKGAAEVRVPQTGPQAGAPWAHRTGTVIDRDALGGLVRRLVTSYAERAEAVTLEAMWRSAFAAASGCGAEVVQEVCESARLPGGELSEERAANEVAAGFEELFGAAVVRLFAPDSAADGGQAEEARRLVQRRDALFDLMEELYPGMYDAT